MKMKRIINIMLFIFSLSLPPAGAQTYKYLGIEDGLSNRRIFSIQKDETGYMWLLTSEGIDRYDGKEIKHYRLIEEDRQQEGPFNLSWMCCQKGELWAMGRGGAIFRYDADHDRFRMAHHVPRSATGIGLADMDTQGRIWLWSADSVTCYIPLHRRAIRMRNPLGSVANAMAELDSCRFFVSTESGVRLLKLSEQAGEEEWALSICPNPRTDGLRAQVSALYLHQPAGLLFMGTYEQGISVYDIRRDSLKETSSDLGGVNITGIVPLDADHLLAATEGMGIHLVDMKTGQSRPYVTADFSKPGGMNSDNISYLYVDGEKRMWVANYPEGVTIIDGRYKNYVWHKHETGNGRSIVNNQVQAVIEDSEGDLWFGTSNGISLYHPRTGEWQSLLDTRDPRLKEQKNHIFIALCEVQPGVVWAGGYTSGLYKIRKRPLGVEYFSPRPAGDTDMRPDKYIRAIIKDREGYVWSGGYYNLKRICPVTGEVRLYRGVSAISALAEKDSSSLWVGTSSGLYLLDKASGRLKHIALQEYPTNINTICQTRDGVVYVGTNGAGVIVYDPTTRSARQYHKDNCALVTNNIYAILPESDETLIVSTENGISRLDLQSHTFQNWTREQGLQPACFSAGAGTTLGSGGCILGSTDGAVEFRPGTRMPQYTYTRMILSDLRISYQPVYPDEPQSPLQCDMDHTTRLGLQYGQNSFSFKVSTINYDAPGNAIFYWKLDQGRKESGDETEGAEGHAQWNRVGEEGVMQFTNLAAGRYGLKIRAVSKEEPYVYFEERNLEIDIAPPAWQSPWALAAYAALALVALATGLRIAGLRKQKKISDEKTRFFIDTAHDIRTPLTLIKAPLEELQGRTPAEGSDAECLETALRNVDALLRLVTNLIDFERAALHASRLNIAEHELNAYMQEACSSFRDYAAARQVGFSYESNFECLSVWFDKEKMDSIVKNLLSNAVKYTPEGGTVELHVEEQKEEWKIEVRDTGIGIAAREQKKLCRLHFRARNAINSKVTGSGIGLMLVRKLVGLHGGKISIESVENQGTTVHVSFPKGKEHFRSYRLVQPALPPVPATGQATDSTGGKITTDSTRGKSGKATGRRQKILVAEDNDELRGYLMRTLDEAGYDVQTCTNGKEALEMVKEFWPELILSDIMMPELRGDRLCEAIKQDMETSHIPVVLLTALGGEQDIVGGLQTGADEYITKPFSISILKASIASLLANRALLRSKYMEGVQQEGQTGMPDEEEVVPAARCAGSLDWKFISTLKRHIGEHMADPDLTVDVLCTLMGMSRTSLYHKLKALTGQSPSDLIRLMRLKRATELLKENRYSVTEVAEMTGFCDGKYFREVFKKQFGMSPTQYGKQQVTSNSGPEP